MAGFNSDDPLWGDHCWTGACLPGSDGRIGLDVVSALDGVEPVGRSTRTFRFGCDEVTVGTDVYRLEVEYRRVHGQEDGLHAWRVEMADYEGSKLVWCGDWA